MAPTHPPAPATPETAAPPAAREECPPVTPVGGVDSPRTWSAPARPRRTLNPADRRLLQAQHRVARYSHRDPQAWRVLGQAIHAHLLAGVRTDQLAAALGVTGVRVRNIRREHSDYDPATDPAIPRQLGEWGLVSAAAAAAGTHPSRLKARQAAASAAGVTTLHGRRRLWHRTATGTWWATAADPAAARVHRADQARQLRAAGPQSRFGFPPGPLLLTDWGPTTQAMFRSRTAAQTGPTRPAARGVTPAAVAVHR